MLQHSVGGQRGGLHGKTKQGVKCVEEWMISFTAVVNGSKVQVQNVNKQKDQVDEQLYTKALLQAGLLQAYYQHLPSHPCDRHRLQFK
jgi:hypothetical protein